MGKNLIQQRRGKGSIRFRSPAHRYLGRAGHRKFDEKENALCRGIVKEVLHSPAHCAPLIRVKYETDEDVLTIAPEKIRVTDIIMNGEMAPVVEGNTLPLKKIPEGTLILNIESQPGDGGKFARSAGTFARIVGKTETSVKVELPSKKIREFDMMCRATIGRVAGSGRLEKPLTKAGVAYYKAKAKRRYWPNVCGQSMNAVAHPHGGKRSSKKNYPYTVSRNAPPGAKVGAIAARRTGRKK